MVLVTMYMALNCVVMTRSSLMRMSMLMTRTRSHSDTEPCCGTCHNSTPVSVHNEVPQRHRALLRHLSQHNTPVSVHNEVPQRHRALLRHLSQHNTPVSVHNEVPQ